MGYEIVIGGMKLVRKMHRGKQQILFNYLPGKTFDFEKISEIAKIKTIRGYPKSDLSLNLVMHSIEEYAKTWKEEFRPALRNDILHKQNQFILIEPSSAESEMFPLIFWCQNRACGRVFDYSSGNLPNKSICSSCNKGKLVQLRFVKIHRCGALHPLRPVYCNKCKSSNNIALDTRGSERISNFRWICRSCGTTFSLFGGSCQECTWSNDVPGIVNPQYMDIEVHRAGRTFYSHNIVLLNQAKKEMNNFLSLNEWPELVAAAFLELPEVREKKLLDFAPSVINSKEPGTFKLESEEIKQLIALGFSEKQIEDYKKMQEQLFTSRQQKQQASSPSGISLELVQRTGIAVEMWKKIGQEMLESVIPMQNSTTQEVTDTNKIIQRLGLKKVTLVADFPILMATFGYSRADYQPNICRLNPFPPDKDRGGKFPIFIDLIQADALFFRLNTSRILSWLELNGYKPDLPNGTDKNLTQQAYFVKLFDDASFRVILHKDKPEARLVFGLMHTFSHLCIRQAALLCGLDRTSLSEYILPRALTFGLYCNHRFGATIGALTSLFEQSLDEWLKQVKDNRRCVYDPVCLDHGGNCHACTHLAETSCRFFNLNLSRTFLFGGYDTELGEIKGYLDPTLL